MKATFSVTGTVEISELASECAKDKLWAWTDDQLGRTKLDALIRKCEEAQSDAEKENALYKLISFQVIRYIKLDRPFEKWKNYLGVGMLLALRKGDINFFTRLGRALNEPKDLYKKKIDPVSLSLVAFWKKPQFEGKTLEEVYKLWPEGICECFKRILKDHANIEYKPTNGALRKRIERLKQDGYL